MPAAVPVQTRTQFSASLSTPHYAKLDAPRLKEFDEVAAKSRAELIEHFEREVLVTLLGPRDGRLAQTEAPCHLRLRDPRLSPHVTERFREPVCEIHDA